jgi:glycosyltransferase involved in cell wall biosynthesis
MKIAVVANNQHPVTIHSGFGVESYCFSLVEGLVKRNHEVTLYASGDSQVPAPVISVHPVGTAMDESLPKEFRNEYQDWLYLEAYNNSGKYDLMITNDPTRSVFYSNFSKTPSFSLVHSPWDTERYPIEVLKSLLNKDPKHYLIAISDYQQKKTREAVEKVHTVLHGINVQGIQFQENSQEYAVFLGRVNKRKGIDFAIDACIKTHTNLKVSGFVAHEKEGLFLKQDLMPKIQNNANIEFLDAVVDTAKKFQLISQGKVFLFPIQWEEPFGLVLVESMASGTPVIAFARGSTPEIVKDGETGFLINASDDDIRGNWIVKKTGFEGLCEAIQRIYSLPDDKYRIMRSSCRSHVEKHFTTDRMIQDYENLFSTTHI